TFLTTLEKWMDEIANFIPDRQTSGFVEGLNNKIKVIKRRCYGILNVKHLFQRIQLDLSGYALFALKISQLRTPEITREPEIPYGLLLSDVVNFLIIAVVLFLFIVKFSWLADADTPGRGGRPASAHEG